MNQSNLVGTECQGHLAVLLPSAQSLFAVVDHVTKCFILMPQGSLRRRPTNTICENQTQQLGFIMIGCTMVYHGVPHYTLARDHERPMVQVVQLPQLRLGPRVP